MDINMNDPNSEETNNDEWLNLSLSISSESYSQQPQPNLQVELAQSSSQPQSQPNILLENIQPKLTQPQPQPQPYKLNPFTFQSIRLQARNPSTSPPIEYDFFESRQVHHPTQSYTQPFQEAYLSRSSQPQPQTHSYIHSPEETYFLAPSQPQLQPWLGANYFPSTSQLQLQPRADPYTASPNPTMSMLQQLDNNHEVGLLPPSDFQTHESNVHQEQEAGPSKLRRPGRLPVRAANQLPAPAANEAKSDTIDPPYQWATSTRATVHSLEHLISLNIISISGTVKCKRCNTESERTFNLIDKFNEVAGFIIDERDTMHHRAPESWTKPVLPKCDDCRTENSMEPVFTRKRSINWLFLLLGQMIGCCKTEYLKYFLKHTKNHRTGAKNRLIYLTYLGICKQLSPNGPFDP